MAPQSVGSKYEFCLQCTFMLTISIQYIYTAKVYTGNEVLYKQDRVPPSKEISGNSMKIYKLKNWVTQFFHKL